MPLRKKNLAPVPLITSAWPTWAHFEEFAAIHNVEFASLNNGFGGADAKLNISAAPFVRNLQRLLDAEKEGIFKYLGRDSKPSSTFFSVRPELGSIVLVFWDSSASRRPSATPLPICRMTPKSLPSRSTRSSAARALWAMTAPNRSAAEYKGIAKFFAFLGLPENDAGFSQSTGYVPVTHAGYQQDVAAVLRKDPGCGCRHQAACPPATTNYSRGIRLGGMPQIRIIIEAAWEGAIASGARRPPYWPMPRPAAMP